jgi:hypothetical protein
MRAAPRRHRGGRVVRGSWRSAGRGPADGAQGRPSRRSWLQFFTADGNVTRARSQRISEAQLDRLRAQLIPLVGRQFTSLVLPAVALEAFEPSQIGTIVGALMDALIPHLHLEALPQIGLKKHAGTFGDREGYPDYEHSSGLRVELKLLYVDNPALKMRRPPTRREPSARLTQKVTLKNVVPSTDAMLLIAYQLQEEAGNPSGMTPTIIDLEVFSMIELVEARDQRLSDAAGRWFGNYETPCVVSRIGRSKLAKGLLLDVTSYGRKESEGKDFNEDTNFGKLKRIPHPGLQAFLQKCFRISIGDAPTPAPPRKPEPPIESP